MKQENATEVERADFDLKKLVFANNPDLYAQIFDDEQEAIPDEQVEWKVPESQSEIDKVLQDLRKFGVAS